MPVARRRKPSAGRVGTVAPRRPRKPGLGNITGGRKPPVGLGRPGGIAGGPGGRERAKPTRPGRPTKPGSGKVGTWQPLKPGGLTKTKRPVGKVAKPRKLKSQVMY